MKSLAQLLTERARRARAAAFAARFASDEATADDWAALTEWLEADGRNGEALDRLVRSSVVAAAANAQARRVKRARTFMQAPVGAWLSAAALAGIAVLFLVANLLNTPSSPASVATAITYSATTRPVRLTLADGTRVWLNRRSRLIVEFDRSRRLISMAPNSEAVFEVVHSAPRPFVVEVADRRVTDLGTAFSVASSATDLKVAVSRGVVSIDGASSAAVRLAPGQMLVHRQGHPADRVARIDPSAIGAWREGRLVYEDASIETVASELSRYLDRPLVVAPSARSLRFTGVLTIDAPLKAVRRLELFIPVAVEIKPDRIVLGARDPHQ